MRENHGEPVALTRDEESALRELALGHTDEVAAARLQISRRTLRRRVRHAMDKLGARSRFQAGIIYGARAEQQPFPPQEANDHDPSPRSADG